VAVAVAVGRLWLEGTHASQVAQRLVPAPAPLCAGEAVALLGEGEAAGHSGWG
jgi:hypothetical protein